LNLTQKDEKQNCKNVFFKCAASYLAAYRDRGGRQTRIGEAQLRAGKLEK
jgi:hypothetical protein